MAEAPIETVLVWLLIEQGDTVLMALRKPDSPPFAGWLVLPGAEMAGDESAIETMGRVAREELDLQVLGEEFVETLAVEDGGRRYAINVFRVTTFEGRPKFRESGPYVDVRWGRKSELADPALPVPEALRALLVARDGSGQA
jgi:ADP-ribose pyrophosphatase YjhB (NUDIX family)